MRIFLFTDVLVQIASGVDWNGCIGIGANRLNGTKDMTRKAVSDMVTCNDCIHARVCPLADDAVYRDIEHIKLDCEYFICAADVAPKREAIKEYLAKVLEKKDMAGHYVPDYEVVSVSVLEYYAKAMEEWKL